MTVLRDVTYTWATWTAKLLVGEGACVWATWFRSHLQHYDEVESDFDSAGTKAA